MRPAPPRPEPGSRRPRDRPRARRPVPTGTGGPVHGTWEPAPAARWEDAFLSGNGRHGAMVFGDPDADRVIVTHHTLVRPGGDDEDRRPPRLAAELPALQDRLLSGDTTAAEAFTDGRPLRWVRPFHPAFQLRLNRPPATPAPPTAATSTSPPARSPPPAPPGPAGSSSPAPTT